MNRNMLFKIIMFILLVCGQLSAEVIISFEETSYQLVQNEDITLSVQISGLTEEALRAYEISINYDTDYFYAAEEDLNESDFLQQNDEETQWYVTGQDGSYKVTCAILGATPGVQGSGTLFTVKLTNLNNDIIAGSLVEITDIILRDPLNNNIIVDQVQSATISIDASPALAEFKLLLEGAWTENWNMRSDLFTQGYLPLISSYDGEVINSLPDCGGKQIVDWLYLELRQTEDGEIEQSANAFLLNDGSLVDVQGNSSFPFFYTSGKAYHVIFSHRNHLPVMTENKLIFADEGESVPEVDCTDAANVYGNFSVKELASGIFGLYSGDADRDGNIFPNDLSDYWRDQTGISGYQSADFNLDGNVSPVDRNDFWRLNTGISSQVP